MFYNYVVRKDSKLRVGLSAYNNNDARQQTVTIESSHWLTRIAIRFLNQNEKRIIAQQSREEAIAQQMATESNDG